MEDHTIIVASLGETGKVLYRLRCVFGEELERDVPHGRVDGRRSWEGGLGVRGVGDGHRLLVARRPLVEDISVTVRPVISVRSQSGQLRPALGTGKRQRATYSGLCLVNI